RARERGLGWARVPGADRRQWAARPRGLRAERECRMLPYAQPRTLGHLLERDVDPRRGQGDDLVRSRPLKGQPPEREPARSFHLLDEDRPLRAVAPPEDAAATGAKVELRIGPEPGGDLLRLRYGRPHLFRRGRQHYLPLYRLHAHPQACPRPRG